MNTPLLPLHKALVKELKRLGYPCVGSPKIEQPVVLIDQIRLTNPVAVKDAQDYEVTFVLDAITLSTSPDKSYEVITKIRSQLNIKIEEYTIQQLTFEECQPIQQQNEQGLLWRQVQRVRILLIQKL